MDPYLFDPKAKSVMGKSILDLPIFSTSLLRTFGVLFTALIVSLLIAIIYESAIAGSFAVVLILLSAGVSIGTAMRLLSTTEEQVFTPQLKVEKSENNKSAWFRIRGQDTDSLLSADREKSQEAAGLWAAIGHFQQATKNRVQLLLPFFGNQK